LRINWGPLYLAALLGLTLFQPSTAQAQNTGGNVFVVRGITVDASAPTATEARAKAVEQGSVIAAERVLRRLAPRESWPSLPKIDVKTADSMLSGFGVEQERVSAQRYIARLSYSFRPDVVRNMLKRARIPFAESATRPSLLLPLLDSSRGIVMGSAGNFWHDAWRSLDLSNSSVPLVIPADDQRDLAVFQPRDLQSLGWPQLERLAGRYNVPRVTIVLGRLVAGGGMQVTTWRHGADEPSLGPFTANFTPTSTERAQGEHYVRYFAQRVARETQNSLEEMWKNETAIDFSVHNSLPATVNFVEIGEWLTIRNKIAGLPAVSEISVRAISVRGAEIDIGYYGNTGKFHDSLKRAGFELQPVQNYWRLALIPDNMPTPVGGALEGGPNQKPGNNLPVFSSP
jgi:hypothetical protein